MKEFRGWMTTPLGASEAKLLREAYAPTFDSSSFELTIPKVDGSMARRLKDHWGQELVKVEAREKFLVKEQHQILDIARSLLFIQK